MYHKWQSYNVWSLRCGAWQTECFVILDHFLPFYPLTTQKRKWRTLRDIIILHMCTKNYDHMIYSSRDMVRNKQTDRQKKWYIGVDAPPKNIKLQWYFTTLKNYFSKTLTRTLFTATITTEIVKLSKMMLCFTWSLSAGMFLLQAFTLAVLMKHVEVAFTSQGCQCNKTIVSWK